jgi:hypothetical protein
VERIVLNALAKELQLCRLAAAPSAIYSHLSDPDWHFLEKPIHRADSPSHLVA